jgi:hypothetical protein
VERPDNEVAVGSTGVEQHALPALDFVRLAELRKVEYLVFLSQHQAGIMRDSL